MLGAETCQCRSLKQRMAQSPDEKKTNSKGQGFVRRGEVLAGHRSQKDWGWPSAFHLCPSSGSFSVVFSSYSFFWNFLPRRLLSLPPRLIYSCDNPLPSLHSRKCQSS